MPGIAVLDLGGQYCHLIARRVRDLGVFSDILPADTAVETLQSFDGVILSGGPGSVSEPGAPRVPQTVLTDLGKPILGICYGQQLITDMLGGTVIQEHVREYGLASLSLIEPGPLLQDIPSDSMVWMSHGDTVTSLPQGFRRLAKTETCDVAAVADLNQRIYGIQFHPEVTHTQHGMAILSNFVFRICHAAPTWNPASLKDKLIEQIRVTAAGRKVYFLVSGGVDSNVAYALCAQALPPDQLEGLYVDTGFMRKNESEQLRLAFARLGLPNIRIIDDSQRFLDAMQGIIDPEEKRQRIGPLFIEIQQELVGAIEHENQNWVLGQGTIYPDTIESGGTAGAEVIKTHHNRVPMIAELAAQNRLLEPLQEFYKDEVRALGEALGLPQDLINRHPFPGPGLAIRTLCSDQHAKAMPHDGIAGICREFGLHGCVLPLKSVGVQGDNRSYKNVAMISGPAALETLSQVSTRITNGYQEVNRVVYGLDAAIDFEALRVHDALLTSTRLDVLREADAIAHQILHDHGLEHQVWQFPVVLIPVSHGAEHPTGNQGETVILRPIYSVDGMTAEFAKLPLPVLQEMAQAIRQLPTIDLVGFDISNKPPATIEWE
ncbi:glutamine-hydrolyzing GMP synthase [Candidatus Entotheonella palauensis]|uniref:glutamine-hydrolyzing GMP synthase n=1 Tax=Candidatus Entotheonella palauensis TaxID=93172 RepID=UPI000B7EE3A0|nr:glutamine-hydrolyzing GMP synthase [Candidatus Entotheonella palauensis]